MPSFVEIGPLVQEKKKVQVGKDQEKAQSEKDSYSKNRGGKKTKLTIMKHIVSRMSSYFPNRWPLSYLNLNKNMKTYIRRQQHNFFLKHQDIKRKEPPQKYRLGTISNTKLLAEFKRVFTIYRHGSHLGHVTWIIYKHIDSPFP